MYKEKEKKLKGGKTMEQNFEVQFMGYKSEQIQSVMLSVEGLQTVARKWVHRHFIEDYRLQEALDEIWQE